TITAPANVTFYANSNCIGSGSLGAPTTADNCSIQSVTNSGNPTYPLGITTVTWTVTDSSGNFTTATQTVTVLDTTAPVLAVPGTVTATFNPSLCSVIAFYIEPTATDNCDQQVHIQRLFGFPNGQQFSSVGTYWNKFIATDDAGNTDVDSFRIVVQPASVTASLSISRDSVQYSDQLTMSVTIPGGNDSCGGRAATSAIFQLIDPTVMGGAPKTLATIPFSSSNGVLVATLANFALRDDGNNSGYFKPGTKTVRVVLNSGSSNYSLQSSQVEKVLVITPENSRTYFTGTYFASTTSASSSTASVSISATIRDISVEGPGENGFDNSAGNISTALVDIQIIPASGTAITIPNLPVSLLNPSDPTVGTVATTTTLTLPSNSDGMTYEVRFTVKSYYTETSTITLQVSRASVSDFLSGGGFNVITRSQGSYKADSLSRNNFGFQIKWNKSNRNLQGGINCIFRRTENGVRKTFQLKGNLMSSLSVDKNTGALCFTGKANLQDITNPTSPVSIFGGLTFQIKGFDKGEPGTSDQVVFTAYNGSTLVYTSHWINTGPKEDTIDGGNIRTNATTSVTLREIEEMETRGKVNVSQNFPSPADQFTHIIFEPLQDLRLSIHLYSLDGRLVRSIAEAEYLMGEQVDIRIDVGDLPQGMYFYHLLGEDVSVSRRMYILH
ncbi:MAG: HYR domain-containing protein, partial [Bacteroidota bacterium]